MNKTPRFHQPQIMRAAHVARRGFTLIEIMIVVLIIGILLAIALPGFVQARETTRTKACIENLTKIQTAQTQYGMDHMLAPHASVPGGLPTLTGAGGYLKNTPACPSGGSYTLNDISTPPTCTFGAAGTGDYALGGPFYHGL